MSVGPLSSGSVFSELTLQKPDNYGVSPTGPLAREGSTVELALLVAEYGLLEHQLEDLATQLSGTFKAVWSSSSNGHGHSSSSSSSSSSNEGHGVGAQKVDGLAALGGLALVDDELLDVLATEVPDLRYRVGVK